MPVDLFNKIQCVHKSSRSWPADFINHIIQGDCVEVIASMPDECIDMVITSPPYFLGKKYEKDWTYARYEELMIGVFRQVHRVLKPGKYFVVNFGDYFNSGNRFYQADVPSVYPASVKYFEWGMSVGFDLQATRIWRKQFARMSIPFVCNHHPRPVFDYEHVWTWRKKNGSNVEFVRDRKLSQRGVIGEEWKQPAGLEHHEAAFPLALPTWAISVYSGHQDDIVLDPFCGSGTTIFAAQELSRQAIGIELSPEYIALTKAKFGVE